MKANRIKRWIVMLLALCLVMGLSNFPLTALAADDLATGETLTELTQDEIMQTNNGTITTNNGTVHTNNYFATVENNTGTVTDNYGTVESNHGMVETNHVTVNINHGTVSRNRGTVTTNYYNAMVETNNGTVESNHGIVSDNFYSVKTNSGTVTTNYYNATVKTNNGTVTTNVEGGTVVDNFGKVTENRGTVENNYGGTVGGTSAINNYYKLTYDADTVTVSGLTEKNGSFYILSTASVTLAPSGGQHFTSVTITPEGATLTENEDGTYTLSGVTENIELTVTAINHSYGTEWKSDGTNHWHECSCGAKTEEAAHSGGTATCEDKAVCSVCGEEYGEFAVHTYKDGKCTVCKAADPNYKPDNPQTGDSSHIALGIVLLLLSGCAVITLTVADRKRKSVVNK